MSSLTEIFHETSKKIEVEAEVDFASMDDDKSVHIWMDRGEKAACGATQNNHPKCQNPDGSWPFAGGG